MYKGKSKKLLTAALIIAALTATACGNSSDDSEAISSKEETKATTAESVQSADDSLDSLPDSSVDDTSTITDSDNTLIVNESGGASEPTYSEFDSISPEPSTVKISSDWTDLEFVLNNEVYTLGKTTLKELYDRGWIDALGWGYDAMTYDGASPIEHFEFDTEDGSIFISTKLKDNVSVLTALELDNTNLMHKKMLYSNDSNTIISMVGLTTSGKITFGSTKDDVINAFGQPNDIEEIEIEDKDYWLDCFNQHYSTSDPKGSAVEYRNYTEDDFRLEKLSYYSGDKEISFEISNLVGVCKITIRQDKNDSFGNN